MEQLSRLTGIPYKELLYHILKGLKEADKVLKKYPLSIEKCEFKFLVSEDVESNIGAKSLVGFESSSKTSYSKEHNHTFNLNDIKSVRPSQYFQWKELANNLFLQFAGLIVEMVTDDYMALGGVIGKSNFSIKSKFSILKSNSGSLGFKFFGIETSGKTKKSKTISHEFTINFKFNNKPPVA